MADAPQQTCYIGLGSNIEPEANLQAAVDALADHPELSLIRVSPVYRTPPWGPVPQDDYLNAVAEVRTVLGPRALLEALQAIETDCGRERSSRAVRWGPRTLDLDLLLYGDAVLDSGRLTLPHPRMAERAFVLVPLCDLAPQLPHPTLGATVAGLLARADRAAIQDTDLRLRVPHS